MRAGHRPLKPLVVILGLPLTGACAGRDDPEYAFALPPHNPEGRSGGAYSPLPTPNSLLTASYQWC